MSSSRCGAAMLAVLLVACGGERAGILSGSPEGEGTIGVIKRLGQARALVARGDLAGALVVVDGELASAPDEPLALQLRGEILLTSRRPKEAEQSLTRLLEVRPDEAEALALRGMACLQMDRLDDARSDLERAVALDPGSQLAQVQLSACHLASGRHEEALAAADRAVVLGGPQVEPRMTRVRALIALRRIDEAVGMLEELFRRAPNSPQLMEMLGPLWLEQGKHGQARDLLQRVVDAEPQNPVPWFHLARARLALGETKAAGEALDRAKELGMRGPAMAELQKAIDAGSD